MDGSATPSALDAHLGDLQFMLERAKAQQLEAVAKGKAARRETGIPDIGKVDKNGRRIPLPFDAATLRTMIRDLRKRYADAAPYDACAELGAIWSDLRRIGLAPTELPVKKLKATERFSKDAGDYLDQKHEDFHNGLNEAERLIDEAFPKQQLASSILHLRRDPDDDKTILAKLQSEFANQKLPSEYLERFRSEIKQLSDEQSKKLDAEFGFLGITLPDDPAEKIALLANAAGIRIRDIPDMTVLELYQEIHGYLNRLRMQAAINREQATETNANNNQSNRTKSQTTTGRSKCSNQRTTKNPKGTATPKIVAGLIKWHGYYNGSVGKQEPASVRGLAESCDVGVASVSEFFTAKFKGGFLGYKRLCMNVKPLIDSLKALNSEWIPKDLQQLYDDTTDQIANLELDE